MNAEVGERTPCSARHRRADQRIAGKILLRQLLLIRFATRRRHQFDMVGHQHFALQRLEPAIRHRLQRGLFKQLVDAGRRHQKPVAGELRMPLPLQPERTQVSAEMVGRRARHLHPVLAAQLAQRRHVELAEQNQIADPHTLVQRFRRAGMHLVVQCHAVRVVARQCQSGCHGCRAPCGCCMCNQFVSLPTPQPDESRRTDAPDFAHICR
jgi:hypothetical protein